MTLLIFDCDGVLVDSELLHAQVEADYAREKLGLTRSALDHHKLFSGTGIKNVFRAWQEETGRSLPPDITAEMARRKNEVFAKQLRSIPYVAETLELLKDLPRCVASGSPMETLEQSLHLAHLHRFFAPHFFSAQMVEHGKPAPDLFLYTAQHMKSAPHDCIVIEDSTAGVQAGLAAEMRVFGFTGASHCYPGYAEKLQGAEVIFSDMRMLPGLVRNQNDVR